MEFAYACVRMYIYICIEMCIYAKVKAITVRKEVSQGENIRDVLVEGDVWGMSSTCWAVSALPCLWKHHKILMSITDRQLDHLFLWLLLLQTSLLLSLVLPVIGSFRNSVYLVKKAQAKVLCRTPTWTTWEVHWESSGLVFKHRKTFSTNFVSVGKWKRLNRSCFCSVEQNYVSPLLFQVRVCCHPSTASSAFISGINSRMFWHHIWHKKQRWSSSSVNTERQIQHWELLQFIVLSSTRQDLCSSWLYIIFQL